MLCSPDILTFYRIVPKLIYMAPKHLLEVPEGPGSAPEVSKCPETVPVCPGRSWKLLEGHGRFQAVPPTPLRPWPWGESHLGFPGRARRWGCTKGRESSSRWE